MLCVEMYVCIYIYIYIFVYVRVCVIIHDAVRVHTGTSCVVPAYKYQVRVDMKLVRGVVSCSSRAFLDDNACSLQAAVNVTSCIGIVGQIRDFRLLRNLVQEYWCAANYFGLFPFASPCVQSQAISTGFDLKPCSLIIKQAHVKTRMCNPFCEQWLQSWTCSRVSQWTHESKTRHLFKQHRRWHVPGSKRNIVYIYIHGRSNRNHMQMLDTHLSKR